MNENRNSGSSSDENLMTEEFQKRKEKTRAVFSCILGIISILAMSILSIPFAIGAIVLARSCREKSSFRTIGLITGSISILLVATVVFLSSHFILRFYRHPNPTRTESYSEEVKEEPDREYEKPAVVENWNRYPSLRSGSIAKQPVLEGSWRIMGETETCWEFRGSTFRWYRSCNDLEDNYWYGEMEIRDRDESPEEGDNFYHIVCRPYGVIIDGEDRTSENMDENEEFTVLWLIVDHGAEGIEGLASDTDRREINSYVKIKD